MQVYHEVHKKPLESLDTPVRVGCPCAPIKSTGRTYTIILMYNVYSYQKRRIRHSFFRFISHHFNVFYISVLIEVLDKS